MKVVLTELELTDLQLLVLAEWVQGSATRILRRSEARRRAVVLAGVGNKNASLA